MLVKSLEQARAMSISLIKSVNAIKHYAQRIGIDKQCVQKWGLTQCR